MAITFDCECGKTLRAREELAGKKSKCPHCGVIFPIPGAVPGESFEAEVASALTSNAVSPEPQSTLPPPLDEQEPVFRPSFSSPMPQKPVDAAASRPAFAKGVAIPKSKAKDVGGHSLMEYSYLLLIFALIPLTFSLLGKDDKVEFAERLEQTIEKASPAEQKRIESVLSRENTSLEEALAVMPGGKLAGAHLARDTQVHWIYAAIAAVAFLLFLGLCFSVERAQAMHLLGIGAFTGTVGIIFLFLVQFCASIRFGTIRGRGIVVIIMLVLAFIGWSYNSANDPDSNFLLSAVGFTFGVGLCEEFTKAIPLFFYFKQYSTMGWRGACLWGLASGIGFGVSEGVMYSSRHYNGVGGLDIYLVRFISCVALHAMWSASVGIAIARNVDEYEGVDHWTTFVFFMLRVMAVPMVLHGFYDTLLKQDMNGWALGVALLSFAWLAWHIELARGSQPDAGRGKVGKGMAY